MSQDIDSLIRMHFSSSKLEAKLHIAKGTPGDVVDEMTVTGIATARGLRHTAELTATIKNAIERYDPDADENFEFVIAEGTPPVHGECGRFELDEELAEIKERAAKLKKRRLELAEAGQEPEDEIQGAASHYDRSTLTIVKPGDRIGRIIPQTEGKDGIDVLGGSIAALAGKPAAVTVDEQTISKAEDGSLTAKIGGLLNTDNDRLRITADLEINGSVDFSTGHVEFDGSILVQKGVRDCFIVRAGESITIAELVEAAELISGKDIEIKRGMAGREKGSVRCGRDLRAKFIDSTDISVARDMIIERELSHCDVTVWRNINAPGATLIGGECTVAGSAEFAQVGTESGTATVIRLGRLKDLDGLIREAADLLPRIAQRADDARRELERLRGNTAKLTASQAESMTELQFVAMNAEGRISPLRKSIGVAIEVVERAARPSLMVHKRILPGTVICIGKRVATITDEIQGPVLIEAGELGVPDVLDPNSGSRTPISRYAKMNIDSAALDLDDVKRSFGLAA
jgi:uncharacterized protein (DUF342 family)